MDDEMIQVFTGDALRQMAGERIAEAHEGFLLMSNGEAATLLPGMPIRAAEALILLRQEARHTFPIGVGNILSPDGHRLGGWATIQCALLSPRRFVIHAREGLLAGESGETLLVRHAREAMRSAFESFSGSRTALWTNCQRQVANALLDWGWQLADFRPEQVELSQEM